MHAVSRALGLAVAVLSLASLVPLLVWDTRPGTFPGGAHLALGAAPLALIAVAYLIYQRYLRARAGQVLRAAILALAFLCWAANQALGDGPTATLMNDLAITLFVVDVALTMTNWPKPTKASC
ncbi:MAG TPA: hypothetical protein VFS62_07475 [Chloroflexota bacterium]|jgi:hypothetical protein|nr:hypothetical protein [Chloroflexota bacterium]